MTWAASEEKVGWLRAAAGERFAELELNVYPSSWPVTVTDDLQGEARRVVDHFRNRSGIELAEMATSQHPAIKVILMSGYFVAQQVNRRFLRKPFRMKELQAAVRAELDVYC